VLPIDDTRATPEAMTEEEIAEAIADYAAAARNAVEQAGFDGVEIHGGNGYLPDQFLQDASNMRTDQWGGSIENRSRFPLAVARAVASAVRPSRTAYRLSPFSDYLGMGMRSDADLYAQFEHVVRGLREIGLAYLHLIDARISGNDDTGCGAGQDVGFLVRTWDSYSPVFIAGGLTPGTARRTVDETYKNYDVAVVFGRYFVSNPDLVFRVKEGVELRKYDRTYFYTPKIPKGYIDYDFSPEYVAQAKA
jgi:NADPH2 dehydrogenase